MKIDKKSFEDFYEKGYCIIDDFLSADEVREMFAMFKAQTQWTQIDQERPHYDAGGPFCYKVALHAEGRRILLPKNKTGRSFAG